MGDTTNRTQMFTRYTDANFETQLFYSADKWQRVTLQLQTAGPCAIGTAQNIQPVLQGRGILLTTDVITQFTLAAGDRLYVATNGTTERILVILEPIPWLEQILLEVGSVIQAVQGQPTAPSQSTAQSPSPHWPFLKK